MKLSDCKANDIVRNAHFISKANEFLVIQNNAEPCLNQQVNVVNLSVNRLAILDLNTEVEFLGKLCVQE